MRSPAETSIDAVPAGTVVTAPGPVLDAPGERLSVRREDRLEVYDRAAFLDGGGPLRSVDIPAGSPAAPLDDGAVLAEPDRVRAVAGDGTTRWELPHPPWRGGSGQPRAPGAPAVSPDGALIGVVVPALAGEPGDRVLFRDERTRLGYGRDVLLLVEAANGRVRARRPVNSCASVVTQRWHPGGGLLALSCWTAWYSWSTWWVLPRHDGLHLRGGARMREVVGFVPGSSRALSLRRSERLAPGDDRDELAAHAVGTDEPVTLYDLAGLAGREAGTDPAEASRGHRESDTVFEDAHL
ncbi:hypothetical protein, partial [Streptomyces sp. NPDC058953]